MGTRLACWLLAGTLLILACTATGTPDSGGAEPTIGVTSAGGADGGTPVPTPSVEVTPALEQPVVTATVAATAPVVPTRTPPVRFDTLPPGAQLPTVEECGHWVRRGDFEPRPENARANHTVPPPLPVRIDGGSDEFNARWAARIDGHFTGTTDEIIQWASCKWGFDEDMTRARAVAETTWRQSFEGDRSNSAATCRLIGKSAPCAQSYGLLQVKGTVHEGTYPWAATSTAFNADYALAWLRACYEGDFTWLKGSYRAGDLHGCVGTWFSGNWKDQGANSYLGLVLDHLAKRRWAAKDF